MASEDFLHFIEAYCSGEPKESLLARVKDVHEKALRVYPYKCVREHKYLSFRMNTHFDYSRIVQDVASTGKRLADIGCCMGTDLRKFMVDAAAASPSFSASQVKGIELEPGFIALGHELFNDKERTADVFVEGNLLAEPSESLPASLRGVGKFDYVYAGSVIHLFDEADIVLFCKRVSQLLTHNGVFFARHVGRLDAPGSVSRVADIEPGSQASEKELRKSAQGVRATATAQDEQQLRYLHTPESTRALLEALGFSNVDVRASASDMPNTASWPSTRCFLALTATWPAK